MLRAEFAISALVEFEHSIGNLTSTKGNFTKEHDSTINTRKCSNLNRVSIFVTRPGINPTLFDFAWCHGWNLLFQRWSSSNTAQIPSVRSRSRFCAAVVAARHRTRLYVQETFEFHPNGYSNCAPALKVPGIGPSWINPMDPIPSGRTLFKLETRQCSN